MGIRRGRKLCLAFHCMHNLSRLLGEGPKQGGAGFVCSACTAHALVIGQSQSAESGKAMPLLRIPFLKFLRGFGGTLFKKSPQTFRYSRRARAWCARR